MADYVMNLRKLIGHIPLVLATAGVIVLDESNRVLLQRRTDDGLWGLPGGSIEPGETVQEAATREVFEETGLRITNLMLFNIFSGEQQHHTYPNGDECYFINTVYVAREYGGKLQMEASEVKELRFFGVDELPRSITPACKPILDQLKTRINSI